MVRAIGLMSGGLDAILATLVVLEQGIEVLAVAFVTPFFGSTRAESACRQLKIPLRVIDISEEHLEMVINPPHGYGKTMNPCIDCHALMFRRAGQLMEAENYDFLFTGEVLGERPMSQNRKALVTVAETSGYADLIVRPLSAQLLAQTEVERKGLVDRQRLLALHGRGRKVQMALAEKYGITDYPTPAGGCLLTEKQFSLRLTDLLTHNSGDVSVRDVEFLKEGRHFRLSERVKLVCGRNRTENLRVRELARLDDVVMSSHGVPGPTAVLIGPADEDVLEVAASLVVRYSDLPTGQAGLPTGQAGVSAEGVGMVRIDSEQPQRIIEVSSATQELIDRLQIK